MNRVEKIPVEASDIHDQNDEYLKFITTLDYTVDSYNKILKTSSVQEMPLIQAELSKIDFDLEKGEQSLVWKTPGINEYIMDMRTKVKTLISLIVLV